MKRKIYIVGDIHCKFEIIFNHLYYNELKDVVYIQVGDFGIGFNIKYEQEKLYELNLLLEERNSDLYVIRGNHDDPSFFTESFLESVFHKNSKYFTKIHLMEDYSVETINDEDWLFVGGAISIDRKILPENLKWWPNECFFYNETRLKKISNISHVVTHNAPSFCFPVGMGDIVHFFAQNDKSLLDQLRYERDSIKMMFNLLMRNNQIKTWWYGHFHKENIQVEGKTTFNLVGIEKIVEFKPEI
jgi:predicted phosphodiesterase